MLGRLSVVFAVCFALLAGAVGGVDRFPHFKHARADGLSAPISIAPIGQSNVAVQFPPSSGAACTFPTFSGLIGRYLASNATTSGGNVTSVNDSSGAGNNVTASGTVPYAATGYNGHPAFNFGGAGALFNSSFPIGTGSELSVFAVGQMNASAVNYAGLASYWDGFVSGNDYDNIGSIVAMARNNGNNSITSFNFNQGNPVPAAISTGTNYRLGSITNGNAGSLYVNGSQAEAWTYVTGPIFISSGTLVLGGRYTGGINTFWYGPVTEFDVWNNDITSIVSSLDSYDTCAYGT